MSEAGFVTVDNIEVPIEGEKNLLSLIRKANIEVPTFCYHSHLSTYGACRLCLVEIDGKKTDAMRRMNLELLLANHTQDCPTCTRSESCKLRDLASKMGVKEVRFPRTKPRRPLDEGSVALDRDPNKCILCGDCVRYCSEVQGIGAVDFAHRGEDVVVTPAFGRSLGEVDCVNCGQCAAVCPTAAIIPKSHVDRVWADVQAEKTYVVAQVAPAVRVALGEMFGMKPGETVTGKITTALRMLGFDAVYDTSFGADLTVMEEAAEFLQRREAGERLPMFTSCCPAWVKFAEQSFPELLPNLSSCMSPQSMVGSLVKRTVPVERGLNPEQVKVVSIMPCTAKKYEVQRPELSRDGQPYVDHVLTTAELGRMIQEAGIRFADLPAASMDLPMGFSSGAGVIFGNSGGVAEAVARYLGDGEQLNVAVVQGIAEAKRLARDVREGRSDYDLVEVMACPGGCIGGAGQPVSFERDTRSRRAAGIRENDAALALRRSSDNPFVGRYYEGVLGGRPGSHEAHELLHTGYRSRKRIEDARIPLINGTGERRVSVRVCVGTSCFLRGSQDLLTRFIHRVSDEGLEDLVDVNATFCSERCNLGPTVRIDDEVIYGATVDAVTDRVKELTGTPVAG
ncbi:MAG: [Fe-Fe] hydrogenase large subunit C-terminal domain-containing protein [Spirochaetota bacterium]